VARWDQASIDDRKILDYLLSIDHPVGADKAAFFVAVGYAVADWTRLRDDLLEVARAGELVTEHKTQFGIKYVVDGLVNAPAGRTVELRTVWITDEPAGAPRLVTAYPR
jgi:hypothetical protein